MRGALLSAVFILCLAASCNVTREEIEATVWLNNFPPASLCLTNPELSQYGFYRRLNNGKLEFMSMCKKEARDFFAIPKADFNRLLDRALPKPQEN